jgi:hypothetical protein
MACSQAASSAGWSSSSAPTCFVQLLLLLGPPWLGNSAQDSGHSAGASKAQSTRSGLLQGKSLTSAVPSPEQIVSNAPHASSPFLLFGSPGHQRAVVTAAPTPSTQAEGSDALRCSSVQAAASHMLELGEVICRHGGRAGTLRAVSMARHGARGTEPVRWLGHHASTTDSGLARPPIIGGRAPRMTAAGACARTPAAWTSACAASMTGPA